MRRITDDEVLQVMTELGLDAEHVMNFRTVRHYLNHEMPKCCIAFNMQFVLNVPTPSGHQLDRLMEKNGLALALGCFVIQAQEYDIWCMMQAEKAGFSNLHYMPCPACVLTQNFKQLPGGCPCCVDARHDEPISL